MRRAVQGLLFVALGAGSMLEAWRITSTVRATATFGILVPDRHLMLNSGLMIISGVLLWLVRADAPTSVVPVSHDLWPLPPQLLMLLALAAFAVGLPDAGFEATCFTFFVAAFAGISRWSCFARRPRSSP